MHADPTRTLNTALPKRILIVRLGAIGDVVNALVFAAAVKKAAPETHIGWVVHPLAQPLVTNHPCVDRVHLWRKRSGVHGFFDLVKELRRGRYELAVDLQRLQKSALIARLSGAKRVLGFHSSQTKELSWLWTTERLQAVPAETHMVDRYLNFARHLGIDGTPKHVLPIDKTAEAWADRTLKQLGTAPILINLGATKPANRWQAPRFGELAQALQQKSGMPVLLTGSEADREFERCALMSMQKGHGVKSSVGSTDLLQLLALMRRARLFVGCDTGPMHMAVALGLHSVVLFGPADPRRTGPFGAVDSNMLPLPGSLHKLVRVPPPCAPCNRKTCNLARHACMDDIRVDHVLSTCLEVLSG